MTDAKRKEMRRDEISTFQMQVENSECFDEITIYTVEVPVREHKKARGNCGQTERVKIWRNMEFSGSCR